MTKGRASYQMKLAKYDVVPPNLTQDIVSKRAVASSD